MVELLVFHIAFHICKAKVHGAIYFLFSFFIILVLEMLFLEFVSWAIMGLVQVCMHLFCRSSKGRCTSWTSVLFIPELLFFLLLQCNGASPSVFLSVFMLFFVLLHCFRFFDSPMSNHVIFLQICVYFLFFLVCFRTYSSCWSSVNNYPELLYANCF